MFLKGIFNKSQEKKLGGGSTGSGFPYCRCWEDKERRPEIGERRPKTGDRRPERQGTGKTGNRKQENGDRKNRGQERQETENRRQETGKTGDGKDG